MFGVVGSWKLEAILATEKEVLMNLDLEDVIDRVEETLLTA